MSVVTERLECYCPGGFFRRFCTPAPALTYRCWQRSRRQRFEYHCAVEVVYHVQMMGVRLTAGMRPGDTMFVQYRSLSKHLLSSLPD
jgi:hypothetical protein